MKKFITSKYFLLNIMLSILIPVIFSLIMFLNEGFDLMLFFILIPWFFVMISFYTGMYNFMWIIGFLLIPYILNYILFIFSHKYFYSHKMIKQGYLFTIFLSIISIFSWYNILSTMLW